MITKVDLGDIKNECFVLMPFGPKFDPIYAEVLRPAIEEIGLVPVRADLIYGSKRIMRDVWNSIRTARLVIAELTGRNANVLYELGLAHALGKPFVIITNSMEDVPFDLKDIRCIVYDKDHPKWGDSLIRNVARTSRSVLDEADEHGPLFNEIETDVPYPPAKESEVRDSEDTEALAQETTDLSGVWSFTHKWEDAIDTLTTLSLEQHGSSLSGFALSTPRRGASENSWKVGQEVSGFVSKDQFELAGTSYQILDSGGDETLSWILDIWRGTIEKEDFVHGDLLDESGNNGTFWGEKISADPADSAELSAYHQSTDETD